MEEYDIAEHEGQKYKIDFFADIKVGDHAYSTITDEIIQTDEEDDLVFINDVYLLATKTETQD